MTTVTIVWDTSVVQITHGSHTRWYYYEDNA